MTENVKYGKIKNDQEIAIKRQDLPAENRVPEHKGNESAMKMDDETKSLMSNMVESNDFLRKAMVTQQEQITDQNTKLNGMLDIFNGLMKNPTISQLVSQSIPQQPNQIESNPQVKQTDNDAEQPIQTMQEIAAGTGAAPNSTPDIGMVKNIVKNGTAPVIPGQFNMDSIKQILGSLSILSSNLGGRKEEPVQNPIAGMMNGIEVASQIAGAMGNGMATLFESFNKMQDRAYSSLKEKKTGSPMAGKITKTMLKSALKEMMDESQNTDGE